MKTIANLVIDGNAPARDFKGYKVVEHVPCGIIQFDSEMFRLFFTNRQVRGLSTYPGTEHFDSLKNVKGLLNSNFLDFILENPGQTPEIMKDNYDYPIYTFFPRTIYEDSRRNRYIRYFCLGLCNKAPASYFMEINSEFGFASYYPSLQLSN